MNFPVSCFYAQGSIHSGAIYTFCLTLCRETFQVPCTSSTLGYFYYYKYLLNLNYHQRQYNFFYIPDIVSDDDDGRSSQWQDLCGTIGLLCRVFMANEVSTGCRPKSFPCR